GSMSKGYQPCPRSVTRRESRGTLAPEMDRGMRLLDRLRVLAALREIVELALEARHRIAPQPPHHLEVRPAAVAAAIERHLQRAELLCEPPDAAPEVQRAARQPVDRRHLLGRVNGIALRHEADAGPEPDARGDRGQESQCLEGIEEAGLAGGGDAAVGR